LLAAVSPLPAIWFVHGMAKGRQSPRDDISELLESVNKVLGSTAAFPGRPTT
jgi:hypothetical protein